MFNVLPDIFKKDILREYRLRIFIVVCTLIIFVQISLGVFLIPSWIESFYQEKEATAALASMNESTLSKNTHTITDVITSTNAKLKILKGTLSYPEVLPLISTIIQKKSSAVHVENIRYSDLDSKSATVQVTGVSDTREALVSFVKNLQSSGVWSSVDLPVSNLAKDKDLDFTLTLNVGVVSGGAVQPAVQTD